MNRTGKTNGAIVRAKITYFFKETFRAHSKAEYREIFSRGLGGATGLSGTFPWLYVRAFFALLMLFTANTLILRLTGNTLYSPSVTFLGGITFSVPFIILLYELYPKRDISLFEVFAVLVVGGTLAGALAQLCFAFITVNNSWLSAVAVGVIEELCKALPAIFVITVSRRKNPFACYLIAAAVGAGFSVIEDMGYIFYYTDNYYFSFNSEIHAAVTLFLDRGLTSFCTHILWTGAIGWAYSYIAKPLKSVRFFAVVILSVGLHICWDLPLDGVWSVLLTAACVAVAAAVNIAMVHISRKKILVSEIDERAVNAEIIREAKAMGERMRFTNAANLTLALMCTFLSALVLLFCALPIGVQYKQETFDSKEEFIARIEGGFNLTADFERPYDATEENFEERYIEGVLTYAVQCGTEEGYDGIYYYGYYVDGDSAEIDTVSVELRIDASTTRVYCKEYQFDKEKIWVFEVDTDGLIDYIYDPDYGTVTAVTDAEEFGNYAALIALCAAGCAVTGGGTVVLIALRIKLRRIKDVG